MDDLTRRDALQILVTAGGAAVAGCVDPVKREEPRMDAIVKVSPLGFPWETPDPFLFCVHHDDRYPAGNDRLGPAASLAGRRIGEDFAGKDGWRMYHGDTVPGFPQHPHRGFETVTVVRRGLLDHSDSMGATARYGGGDVQWLTAGRGILHAEMFPLVKPDQPNPLELFQIWVNLPGADKLVDPHFSMFWAESVPTVTTTDDAGRRADVTLVAGQLGTTKALAPPPKSWAARPTSDFAIWTIRLAAGARWTLPAAQPGTNRRLYFFRGTTLRIDGREVPGAHAVDLRPDRDVVLEGGADECEALLLQGRPIAEPVVQYGPFVMNTREQIHQTIAEYQRTQFGGWPWQSDDPVHAREEGRFARHADGKVDRPT